MFRGAPLPIISENLQIHVIVNLLFAPQLYGHSLSRYDGVETEVIVLSGFMFICARSRWLTSLYFRIITGYTKIRIAEMKRATTMSNIEWNWDKGFVQGDVLFNIKQSQRSSILWLWSLLGFQTILLDRLWFDCAAVTMLSKNWYWHYIAILRAHSMTRRIYSHSHINLQESSRTLV
jgi:hypothetical protein